MRTIYCHSTDYGHNFGINISEKETARIFRYDTNGHINSDYAYLKWMPLSKMKSLTGLQLDGEYISKKNWPKLEAAFETLLANH